MFSYCLLQAIARVAFNPNPLWQVSAGCPHSNCPICRAEEERLGREAIEYAKQLNEKKADYKERCKDYLLKFRKARKKRLDKI